MDVTVVRQHLKEVKTELRANEEQHEWLLNLVTGYEGWLKSQGYSAEDIPALQLGMPTAPEERMRHSNRPKGEISMRKALLRVLKDARGSSLHAKEILHRAQVLGAITTGKNPVGLVDLNLHSMGAEGVEKVAPRTWRWVEPTLGGNGDRPA